MCEVTDKWFVDNGYITVGWDNYASHGFETIQSSDKMRNLVHQCLQKCHTVDGKKILIGIITPEILMETINEGVKKRPKPSTYTKVLPEEKLRRKKERQKIKKERKLKDANRTTE